MENIIAIVALALWFGNLIVSVSYPIVIHIINYVGRSDLGMSHFEDWKSNTLKVEDIVFGQFMFYVVTALVWLVVYFSIDPLLNLNTQTDVAEFRFEYVIASVYYCALPLIAICLLPAVRWSVDVARNLKVKSDTGDSERLRKLEDEIEKLKMIGG